MALFHPLHYSTEYGMFDKDFRDKCCGSGLCEVFHARRPIDPSLNYIPPFFGRHSRHATLHTYIICIA